MKEWRGYCVRRLYFRQAEPLAGKGRRDHHHAGIGGCLNERHDAESHSSPW
jgi:hypothetical protein